MIACAYSEETATSDMKTQTSDGNFVIVHQIVFYIYFYPQSADTHFALLHFFKIRLTCVRVLPVIILRRCVIDYAMFYHAFSVWYFDEQALKYKLSL